MDAMLDRLEELEEDLASRAFLYDHPSTYRQTLEVAFESVRALLARLREQPRTA
jgi:hypothetical protein